jgi:DDE superfamily endonuclease
LAGARGAYTPASRLPGGERDPGFRTKPQLAVELVQAAREAGVEFRAVVADCFYGDNPGFTHALGAGKVPFVLALKPRKGTWGPANAAHTPVEAAGDLGSRSPTGLGGGGASSGASVTGTPRLSGRPLPPSAASGSISGCGWWWPPPTRPRLPGHSSWYLLTNLPRPSSRRA